VGRPINRNLFTVAPAVTHSLTAIVQNQQVINGNVIIGPGLDGSGTFTETVTKDGTINFTDTPSDALSDSTIIFTGSLQADGSLNGTYTVDVSQLGIWHAAPA
jgi:hypothetical protein